MTLIDKSTALLVIDMQLCAFDGVLIAPVDDGSNLLNRVKQLISAARQAKMHVIYIQHCAPFDGQPYAKDTHGWEIHPSLTPTPDETVVFKSQSSGFADTNLQSVLLELGIEAIITCGIQSEFCLTNTSLAAHELGFKVLVAQDAHGTVSNEQGTAAEIVDRQNALLAKQGATLITTRQVVKSLTAA